MINRSKNGLIAVLIATLFWGAAWASKKSNRTDSIKKLSETPTSYPSFVEVASLVGLHDHNPAWGLSWNDFDNDGDFDLYVSNHMFFKSYLYENIGGLYFKRSKTKLGTLAGKDDHLASWSDYDGDRDWDVYLANGYYHQDWFFIHDGKGNFEESTLKSGITKGNHGSGRTGLWLDATGDGWNDLIVYNRTETDPFYRNLGNGKFVEEGYKRGISNTFYKVGATPGDYDNDGDIDIYVPTGNVGSNLLFLNRGDGTFVERSIDKKVAAFGWSWISTAGDYDTDGDLDLFVMGGSGQTHLFQNDGNANFKDVAGEAGVSHRFFSRSNGGFVDVDNDGYLDLFVNSGKELVLWRNNGNGTFNLIGKEAGLKIDGPFSSFASAFGDFDRDGFEDIAVSMGAGEQFLTGPNLLFKNRGVPPKEKKSANWVRIFPDKESGSRDGLGARIKSYVEDGRVLMREYSPIGIMTQNAPGVHIGLGASSSIRHLSARWPNGMISSMQSVPASSYILIEAQDRPNLINTHPAGLIGGNVDKLNIDNLEKRIRKLTGYRKKLPKPDKAEVQKRQDYLLAYYLIQRNMPRIIPTKEKVEEGYKNDKNFFSLPGRKYLDLISLGKYTIDGRKQPLNLDAAKKVKKLIQENKSLQYIAEAVNIHTWNGNTVRGYLSSGWYSKQMLSERFKEMAKKIDRLAVGKLLGPMPIIDYRDRNRKDNLHPLLRFVRVRAVEKAMTIPFDAVRNSLVRYLLETYLDSYIISESLSHPVSVGSESLHEQFFGTKRQMVKPLAKSARVKGYDKELIIQKAFERIKREASLNKILISWFRKMNISKSEIQNHIDKQAKNWGSDIQVKGVHLFFKNGVTAFHAYKSLKSGSSFEYIVDTFDIPSKKSRKSRNNDSFYNPVLLSDSIGYRMFRSGWEKIKNELKEGDISFPIFIKDGYEILIIGKKIPADFKPTSKWKTRAKKEIKLKKIEKIMEELLGFSQN